MIRNLEKRLRKLESTLPPEQTGEQKLASALDSLAIFLINASGYYFGDPKPHEAKAAATARALGYEHEGKLSEAMKVACSKGKNSEFNERYAYANRRLFAKFGVNLETADGEEFLQGLRRIHAGLPDSYKTGLRIMIQSPSADVGTA